MVISFLKDHCLKKEWILTNAKLVNTITSSAMRTRHIEALFNSCKNNKIFSAGFASYIEVVMNSQKK
jgi:hypothetical protein